jgi:acyl CoA:acetate/3-ketoacid CoA transferase alpha subunit
LAERGPDKLTIASLTAGIDSFGLGRLYESGKVKRMIGSYVGENKVRIEITLFAT